MFIVHVLHLCLSNKQNEKWLDSWHTTENTSVRLKWKLLMCPLHQVRATLAPADPWARVSCLSFYWNGVCVCDCAFMCVQENTSLRRPNNPIRGQIWVRVYQKAWTQTRYITDPSSVCLPCAYLFIPWKLTGVASMTKQNGFCHLCLSLVKVIMVGGGVCTGAADLKQHPPNDPEKCTNGD